MLKISSAQRENIKMVKPQSFESLRERICLIYEIQVFQLVLTYENDNEEIALLVNDSDYSIIIDSQRDYSITAYIKPLSQLHNYIIMLLTSVLLIYALMKYSSIKSLSVNISDNSEYLLYLFIDIYTVLSYLFSALIKSFYWIPIIGSFVHFLYLIQYWCKYYISNKKISKVKMIFKVFFLMNFIPSIIGYILSMITIIWFVLVYFNVLFHRSSPRSVKDTSFLRILGLMIITTIPRIIYFY